jgi:hypothetical protein
MDNKEIEKINGKLKAAALNAGEGLLDTSSIEEVIQTTWERFYEKGENAIRSPQTWLNHTVRNIVFSILRERRRQKTDQFDDLEHSGQESAIVAFKERKAAPSEPLLEALARENSDRFLALEKCVGFITLLYYLKRERLSAESHELIPLGKTIRALQEAAEKIGALNRTLSPGVIRNLRARLRKSAPLQPGQREPIHENDPEAMYHLWNAFWKIGGPMPREIGDVYRDGLFYSGTAKAIIKKLEVKIEKLKERRAELLNGPAGLMFYYARPLKAEEIELNDFVLDSIPRLRADPAMLLFRIVYKMFRKGGGRYGNRKAAIRAILELKTRKKDTLQEFVFASITADTNFETFRKKFYLKSKDPFYDQLADAIIAACTMP